MTATASNPALAAGQGSVASERHIPALDGLRGLAIMIVMFGHLLESALGTWGVTIPGGEFVNLGWTGVNLFFVLSGFLITGILYDAKGGEHFFRNFYARRALRIFPLYYAALTVALALSMLAPELGIWGDRSQGWLWIYLSNYQMAIHGSGSFGALDHFWSLAVEEHFYLVWPAVIFLTTRRGAMIAAALAIATAFLVRLSCVDNGEAGTASYVMTHARLGSLGAGAFLALAMRGPLEIKPFVKPAFVAGPLALAAFLTIAVTRGAYDPEDLLLGTIGHTLLWIGFASLLVLSLRWRPAAALFSDAVLRWFGKYSYGLYVWHHIVFMIVFHSAWGRALRLGPRAIDLPIGVALALGLTIGIAMLSWRFWESRFLELKHHFR